MVEKTALGIELPVSVGRKTVIVLPDGKKAVTFPKMINSISYNEGYIFITFTTKNSLYRDIPIRIMPQYGYYNGQFIAPGYGVMNGQGEVVTVNEIVEINNSGIIINTDRGGMMGQIAFIG